MTGAKIILWREEEYSYPAAYGFIPFMVSYIHEEGTDRPAMIIIPGGAYRKASPSEAHLPAEAFYREGYNVFVLVYTVNLLDTPLKLQPLHDVSRAVRIIRAHAKEYFVDPAKIALCGFSAGGHLAASLCVHCDDVPDSDPAYGRYSNRPDAAVLAYPVIASGKYTHGDSMKALLGEDPDRNEREYMSLEKYVTPQTPPAFLWQTVTDCTVPVENSYLFAAACRKNGVPYAHHVFSEGVHGMSVATEQWLERDFGIPYSLEQIRMLASAVSAGKTDWPIEKGKEILKDFGLDGTRKEKWTQTEKEKIRKSLGEVGSWIGLAVKWLDRVWNGSVKM